VTLNLSSKYILPEAMICSFWF